MAISRTTTGQVHLDTVEDVVAYIPVTVANVIAGAGHNGHDVDTVLARLTTDEVLDMVRAAYVRWASQGRDRAAGIREIGVRLIQEYRRTYGI